MARSGSGKIITDADYFHDIDGKTYQNIRVMYEPAPRKRNETPLTQTEKAKYGAFVPCPRCFSTLTD